MPPVNNKDWLEVCTLAEKIIDCTKNKVYDTIYHFEAHDGELMIRGIHGHLMVTIKGGHIVEMSTSAGILDPVIKYANRTSVAHFARVGCSPWWTNDTIDGSFPSECHCAPGLYYDDFPKAVTSSDHAEAKCQPPRPDDAARFALYTAELKKKTEEVKRLRASEAAAVEKLRAARGVTKDLRDTVASQADEIAKLREKLKKQDKRGNAVTSTAPDAPNPTPDLAQSGSETAVSKDNAPVGGTSPSAKKRRVVRDEDDEEEEEEEGKEKVEPPRPAKRSRIAKRV